MNTARRMIYLLLAFALGANGMWAFTQPSFWNLLFFAVLLALLCLYLGLMIGTWGTEGRQS